MNIDKKLLKKQYVALQLLILNEPDSVLWGLVEMLGDMIDADVQTITYGKWEV